MANRRRAIRQTKPLLRLCITCIAAVLSAGGIFFPLSGCAVEGPIEVDSTTEPVRFIINHRGWPRPFWSPDITEFAIASEEEGPIWQLEAATGQGVKARQLAILFGRVPSGFVQTFPAQAEKPRRLKPGRNYFVAAGGPKAVFKVVFAVPIDGYTPEMPDFGNVGATTMPDEPTTQPIDP